MKKLPMSEQNLVTTYNIDASFLSMAASHYKQTAPWIYGNFIQIKGFKGTSQNFFYESQHDRDTPFFSIQRISREIIGRKWNNIIEFVIDCVDLDFYILLLVNNKYLSVSEAFGITDYYHDIFIYGYDLEKEVFYIAGNFTNGKYMRVTCSFCELNEAYINLEDDFYDWLFGVVLYKYRENESHKVDRDLWKRVKSLLKHYVECTHMSENDYAITTHYDRENLLFGYDVYQNTIEILVNNMTVNENIDIRPFHLFLDHKKIMQERFKYLNANKYFDPSELDLVKIEKIVEMSEIHRNIAIKYNLTKDRSVLERLINLMKQFINYEKEYYLKIIG
ncbi:hypothetical protein [Paenibacillus piscarius]|uniref:hypothetical protein n=1 Tax=Paenibacillus piscarius TaxID=1089681 RepID=UPI001EE8636B|nr:hypothetical protein [Paenibacillus piscarius]